MSTGKRLAQKRPVFAILSLLMALATINAQEEDAAQESVYKIPVERLWLNSYGNIRISKRLFLGCTDPYSLSGDSGRSLCRSNCPDL